MRTDPSKSDAFRQNPAWKQEQLQIRMHQRAEPGDGDGPTFRAIPFSGGERNRLFLSRHGNFKDATLISGADYREDGRGFVLFDYNGDQFLDMAVVSPNEPRLRIVKNRLAELDPEIRKNKALRIKLIGGQTSAEPSREWSPRDPYGAVVKVQRGDSTTAFQLSCGEGLSSQNSRWIHVGLGNAESIDRLQVTWPSGKTSEVKNVASGEITIYENPEMDPDKAVDP